MFKEAVKIILESTVFLEAFTTDTLYFVIDLLTVRLVHAFTYESNLYD